MSHGQTDNVRQPLRILIAEDSRADVELTVASMKEAGYAVSFDHVDSQDAFQNRLQKSSYDLVLSDHNLGSWTGVQALEMVRSLGREMPFVVITATLGDEAAVEYIKQGASDYVLKGRLSRLHEVIERALSEKAHREEAARLQEEILKSKQEWELTFDSVRMPVFVLDDDSVIQRANRAAVETLGLDYPQLIGRHCYEVVHGQSAPPPYCPHCRLKECGQQARGDLVEPRLGKVFDLTSTPLRDSGGEVRGSILVMADITERKLAEDALHRSETRYRELMEHAVYGIYRSSVDGRFLEVNPAMVSMLGYGSKEELLTASLTDDIFRHASERDRVFEQYRQSDSFKGLEVNWKRKDGRPIQVRLSGRLVSDAQGELEGCECIAEDITEYRALEEQFRQSQKMEAVGLLAGGVAHDFNNLLSVILGYSTLQLERTDPSDPRRRHLEEIHKAGQRAADLTRQLLAFGRKQVLEPRLLNLNVVLSEAVQLLRRIIGEDVELFLKPTPDLGTVKTDPGQVEQVLMNLCVNARDAMPMGGKLTIETANVELDEAYARQHPTVEPGSYVLLAVSDTGVGMDPVTKARIFEPFFTTKEKDKGTGLGLSTVYGIVKQSGGSIQVYSEPGVGTTFNVYFPRVKDTAAAARIRKQEARPVGGTETVLLVEDEEALRELVQQFLVDSGYRVLAARNGQEAIRLCEQREGPIDLMVTDIVMPGMSGREVAQRLNASCPQTKVLFVSGYAEHAVVHNGVVDAGAFFLQKPFTLEALASKVREALDAGPAAD